MLYALWLILFLHSACAEERTLSEGEAIAFEAVFGTSDMKKLLKIERDPAAYWKERQEALKRETISHIEFCQRYTEESLAYIRENAPRGGTIPWFCQDPTEIEKTIASQVSKDHPAYPTFVALYTSMACDYLRNPHNEKFENVATQEAFSFELYLLTKTHLNSPEFNERLRWMVRENANFSIFDSLILFSQKQYLCGAPTAGNREGFMAHEKIDKPPTFSGFCGPIKHDVIGHALAQYSLENTLDRYGVSYHEYFRQCWNKEGLIKNNIIRLAQKVLGCFYQFHELSSAKGAWSHDKLTSLIFPQTTHLTDRGFCEITPYFTNQGAGFNWHKKKIEPSKNHHDIHARDFLLSCKETFCDKQGKALLQKTFCVDPEDPRHERSQRKHCCCILL